MGKVAANIILPPGLEADIPLDNDAAKEGRIYFTTDSLKIFRDNGFSWIDVTPASGSSLSVDDYSTVVNPTNTIHFIGATVSDLGSGELEVEIDAPSSGNPTLWVNQYPGLGYDTTTTEHSLFAEAGIGSKVLPANFFDSGKIIIIDFGGYLSAKASSPGTWTFAIGFTGNHVVEVPINLPNSYSGHFRGHAEIFCDAPGISSHVDGYMTITLYDGSPRKLSNEYIGSSFGLSTANTTGALTIDMSIQMSVSDAANSFHNNIYPQSIRFIDAS